MSHPLRSLAKDEFPALLSEIPDEPEQLTVRGTLPPANHKLLAVVGAREYTPYARAACEHVVKGLRGHPVTVVSGLALGIDGIAHRAALEAGVHTVAVPGSGLDDSVLYPATHRRLAHDILEAGGALLSEFESKWRPRPYSFPQRNRIMAGMSHATLIVEASLKSGTLITAKLAADYNRDVCAIPGPVDSATSAGPHMLLKRGAALIESADDILEALGLDGSAHTQNLFTEGLSDDETTVLELLKTPQPRDELLRQLEMQTAPANALLAELEIKGLIEERMGKVHRA